MFPLGQYQVESAYWGGQDRMVYAVLNEAKLDLRFMKGLGSSDYGLFKNGDVFIDIRIDKDYKNHLGLDKLPSGITIDTENPKSLKPEEGATVRIPKKIFDELLKTANRGLSQECSNAINQALDKTPAYETVTPENLLGCLSTQYIPPKGSLNKFLEVIQSRR